MIPGQISIKGVCHDEGGTQADDIIKQGGTQAEGTQAEVGGFLLQD